MANRSPGVKAEPRGCFVVADEIPNGLDRRDAPGRVAGPVGGIRRRRDPDEFGLVQRQDRVPVVARGNPCAGKAQMLDSPVRVSDHERAAMDRTRPRTVGDLVDPPGPAGRNFPRFPGLSAALPKKIPRPSQSRTNSCHPPSHGSSRDGSLRAGSNPPPIRGVVSPLRDPSAGRLSASSQPRRGAECRSSSSPFSLA